jgi:hypothetical protein
MKKTVKILYLPTEEVIKNHIVKHFEEGALLTINDTLIGKVVDSQVQIQDLYATISPEDEPIKEGDWVIRLEDNHIWQVDTNIDVLNKLARAMGDWFKIIATTDPKLYGAYNENIGSRVYSENYRIPQLQQSFLKEFVANPGRKFKVEYVETFEAADPYPSMQRSSVRLKLNQDNTVNITAVEKKMYSKGDIIEGMKAMNLHIIHTDTMKGSGAKDWSINWIKENL